LNLSSSPTHHQPIKHFQKTWLTNRDLVGCLLTHQTPKSLATTLYDPSDIFTQLKYFLKDAQLDHYTSPDQVTTSRQLMQFFLSFSNK